MASREASRPDEAPNRELDLNAIERYLHDFFPTAFISADAHRHENTWQFIKNFIEQNEGFEQLRHWEQLQRQSCLAGPPPQAINNSTAPPAPAIRGTVAPPPSPRAPPPNLPPPRVPPPRPMGCPQPVRPPIPPGILATSGSDLSTHGVDGPPAQDFIDGITTYESCLGHGAFGVVLKIRQIFYGLSVTTTEVAYFTYMYANIEKNEYKRVTSYTHSAVHFGQFVSGMTGQLLISFNLMDFEELNYLSLGGGVGALFFALFLPRVLRDVEEEKALKKEDENEAEQPMKQNEKEGEKGSEKEQSPSPIPAGLDYTRNIGKARQPSRLQRWREAPSHWKNNILYTYTNRDIVKWSVWWAMSYGLYIQVDLYVEGLWKEIEHHSHQNVYNGAVHASHAIISVGLGLIVGRTKTCWIKWGCLVFGVSTVLQGVALFVMAKTHDLYVAYGMFILFQTMFQVLVIIAKSQVAESVREKTEAFIFGMNTLTACIIHLLSTMAVTSRHGFHLPIRDQYIVYGVYAVLLGVGFGCCDLPRKLAGKTRSWSVDVRNNLRRSPKVRGENEKIDKDDEKELETISASMPYSIPREH